MHRPSAIGIVNCLCLPVLFSRQADLATHVEWIVIHTNIYMIIMLIIMRIIKMISDNGDDRDDYHDDGGLF